ncbi:MAG: hypothetical protein IPL97_11705 [Niastella sp.]|nr:hypothetical protein [Niastella sp.]
MEKLQFAFNKNAYPLRFVFKITTLANDFVAKDANDELIAYVRQKLFRLIDDINVYEDEQKMILKYNIKANKWIDFSASYKFTDANGRDLGRVARKGWASIWKARYEIFDENQNQDLLIREENAWTKFGDAVFSEIPLLGMFTGYFFNPAYTVTRPNGSLVARLKKEASFFGRRFTVHKLSEFEEGEEERILLGLMMMILLERRRG